MYQQDYDSPRSQEEVDLVGSFLQQLHDIGDIWEDFEASQHVQLAFDLDRALHEVEDTGFSVFAGRVSRGFRLGLDESTPVRMTVATIVVMRSDNPRILLRETDREHIAAVFSTAA